MHTITFGTWPKWKSSGPGYQQQAYLQSAGQGFGEGVHVASAVGGGLNPRPSPVLVTPSGNFPITQPVPVTLTVRATDVHGRINAEKRDLRKAGEDELARNSIDAHELKKEFLGKKAQVSHYDLYVNKVTNELWIYRKGMQGNGIPTGLVIK